MSDNIVATNVAMVTDSDYLSTTMTAYVCSNFTTKIVEIYSLGIRR